MKLFNRVLLILSILASIVYFPAALNIFISITSDPEGWQAGVNMGSTITWFIVITFGYGFLVFQTFLALLGLFFGFRKRKAAFWLLLLPGFVGIILGLIWLGLFMAFDLEWPTSWNVVAILIIPPTITYFVGRFVRKKVLPKPIKTK